jgi:hypothetical protein
VIAKQPFSMRAIRLLCPLYRCVQFTDVLTELLDDTVVEIQVPPSLVKRGPRFACLW